MSVKFTIQSRLSDLADQLPKNAQARTAQVTQEIADQARQHAPVKTGALRDSITVETDSESGKSSVRVGVPYAGFQEYGTSKMAAHPFLTPAVEAIKPKLASFYKDLIK
jgi:HK97 gp10 family phage protein